MVAGKKEVLVTFIGDKLLQVRLPVFIIAPSRGGVREARLRRLLEGELPVDRVWMGDLLEPKESEWMGSFQSVVNGGFELW